MITTLRRLRPSSPSQVLLCRSPNEARRYTTRSVPVQKAGDGLGNPHQGSPARMNAERKLPKRRRIVRSVGTMALAVHESAVGRAPNSGDEVPDRLQGRLIAVL